MRSKVKQGWKRAPWRCRLFFALLPVLHVPLLLAQSDPAQLVPLAASPAGATLDRRTTPADTGQGGARPALSAAELAARQAVAQQPNSPSALERLGQILLQERQPAAASLFFRRAIALDQRPAAERDAAPQLSLADALMSQGKHAEAEGVAHRLIAAQPKCEEAYVDLGAALARQGRFADAEAAYRDALRLQAADEVARSSLVKALVTLLQYAQAEPLAVASVAHAPQEAEAHYLLGTIHRHLQHLPQARKELETAQSLGLDSYELHVELGSVLKDSNEHQAAIDQLKKAVAARPHDVEAHFQLATLYRKTGQPALAAQEATLLRDEQDREQRRRQATVLGNQGARAMESRDFAGAAQSYSESVRLSPDDPRPLYDLALVEEHLGQRTEETERLRAAIALDPSFALAHNQLGYLLAQSGDAAAARHEFQTAIASDPQCVPALGNLGVLLAREGNLVEAEQLLRQAVETDPSYRDGLANLSLVRHAEGLPDTSTAQLP